MQNSFFSLFSFNRKKSEEPDGTFKLTSVTNVRQRNCDIHVALWWRVPLLHVWICCARNFQKSRRESCPPILLIFSSAALLKSDPFFEKKGEGGSFQVQKSEKLSKAPESPREEREREKKVERFLHTFPGLPRRSHLFFFSWWSFGTATCSLFLHVRLWQLCPFSCLPVVWCVLKLPSHLHFSLFVCLSARLATLPSSLLLPPPASSSSSSFSSSSNWWWCT